MGQITSVLSPKPGSTWDTRHPSLDAQLAVPVSPPLQEETLHLKPSPQVSRSIRSQNLLPFLKCVDTTIKLAVALVTTLTVSKRRDRVDAYQTVNNPPETSQLHSWYISFALDGYPVLSATDTYFQKHGVVTSPCGMISLVVILGASHLVEGRVHCFMVWDL